MKLAKAMITKSVWFFTFYVNCGFTEVLSATICHHELL